jgi:hypothetical protein
MNPKLPAIATESIERAALLLSDCVATGSIGVLTGPNGSGKTEALKALVGRYAKIGTKGTALYFRCCLLKSHTRGLKDLAEAMGRKLFAGSNSTGSVQFAIRTCIHEMERQGITAIFLDDADLWSEEVLENVIALRDKAHEKGWPLVVILAGATNPDNWLGRVASARSRTLKVEAFQDLGPGEMLGILRSWNPVFEAFTQAVAEGDKKAEKCARTIHAHTKGNMRRLSYFALLYAAHAGDASVSPETLEKVLPHLNAA